MPSEVLRKMLTAVVAIRMAAGDWDKAKAAVDYALYLKGES